MWNSMMSHQCDLWLSELKYRFSLTNLQVMRLTGLSRATLFRIQAGHPVSERTRAKLLQAYAKLLVGLNK